jgi:hypothetical protein
MFGCPVIHWQTIGRFLKTTDPGHIYHVVPAWFAILQSWLELYFEKGQQEWQSFLFLHPGRLILLLTTDNDSASFKNAMVASARRMMKAKWPCSSCRFGHALPFQIPTALPTVYPFANAALFHRWRINREVVAATTGVASTKSAATGVIDEDSGSCRCSSPTSLRPITWLLETRGVACFANGIIRSIHSAALLLLLSLVAMVRATIGSQCMSHGATMYYIIINN